MENIRIFFFVLSTDNMILQVVTVNLAPRNVEETKSPGM